MCLAARLMVTFCEIWWREQPKDDVDKFDGQVTKGRKGDGLAFLGSFSPVGQFPCALCCRDRPLCLLLGLVLPLQEPEHLDNNKKKNDLAAQSQAPCSIFRGQ